MTFMSRTNLQLRMIRIKELCLLNKIIIILMVLSLINKKRFNFVKKNCFSNTVVHNKILNKIFSCHILRIKIISMINLIKRIIAWVLRKMVILRLENNLFLRLIKWDQLNKSKVMIGLTLFYQIFLKEEHKFFFRQNSLVGCKHHHW